MNPKFYDDMFSFRKYQINFIGQFKNFVCRFCDPQPTPCTLTENWVGKIRVTGVAV